MGPRNAPKAATCRGPRHCDGLKVVFRPALVDAFSPYIIDCSPEDGRFATRRA